MRFGLFPAAAMTVGAAISLGMAPLDDQRRTSGNGRTSIVCSARSAGSALSWKYSGHVKKICDTILDAIGETPLVRINRITRGIVKGTVLAKVETFNPGNSIKDRMAVKMIQDAEKAGLLKPGGTIVEGTSGNTGMGLAITAVVKGYKCVFTTTDKQSK